MGCRLFLMVLAYFVDPLPNIGQQPLPYLRSSFTVGTDQDFFKLLGCLGCDLVLPVC